MAQQVSLIQFKGKLAQVVGFRGADGKNLLRERLTSIANPQTPDQVKQRARFKLTTQLAAMFGDLGKVILTTNGVRSNARGYLNKLIMPNVEATEAGEAKLNHVLQLIKNPVTPNHVIETAITIDQHPTVESMAVVAGLINGMKEGDIATKCLLIYFKTSGQWLHASATGTDNSISINIPASQSQLVNVYFYATVATPSTSKGKAIYDSITGPDEDYKLLAARLDSTNFNYSRMLSGAVIDNVEIVDTDGSPSAILLTVATNTGAELPVRIANGETIFFEGNVTNGQDISVPEGNLIFTSSDSNVSFTVNEDSPVARLEANLTENTILRVVFNLT